MTNIKASCFCSFPFVETSFSDVLKTLTVFTSETILFTNRPVDNNKYFDDNDDLVLRCTRCGAHAEWVTNTPKMKGGDTNA